MRSNVLKLFLTIAAAWTAGPAAPAAEKTPAFPNPNSQVPSSFSPLIINGNWKDGDGKPVDRYHSVVCHFGLRPVVLVFARDPNDDAVLDLLKKLEGKIEAHQDAYLSGFAVFLCHDDKRQSADVEAKELIKAANAQEKLVEELKEKVKAKGLKHILVGIDNPRGPRGYDIGNKDDVVVVLYHKFKVVHSRVFERGGLDDKATADILKEVDKLAKSIKKPRAAKKESEE
jgi:hypothetical protein